MYLNVSLTGTYNILFPLSDLSVARRIFCWGVSVLTPFGEPQRGNQESQRGNITAYLGRGRGGSQLGEGSEPTAEGGRGREQTRKVSPVQTGPRPFDLRGGHCIPASS